MLVPDACSVLGCPASQLRAHQPLIGPTRVLRLAPTPPARVGIPTCRQLLEQASSADGVGSGAAPYDPYGSAAFGVRVRPQGAQA